MQKRIVTILVATAFVFGTGIAAAQSRGGGGMHGGGGMGGGGMQGGSSGWHGGGGWNGGGGGWHGGGGSWNGGSWHGGGGSWNGGSWNNGWRGGSWNSGWRGGCWNCGWNGGWWGGRWVGGTNVGIFFGFPGTWWWPGVAPGWGGWGWGPQVVSTPTFVDQNPVVFIQRDQVVDGAYSAAPRTAPANEFWHYCIDPPGYFPQVQQCNKEWLKVVPNNNSRPAQVPQYQ